jgi:hypothetical protein
MNEKSVTGPLARRFLLGAVNDSERQQLESLFMIDPETKETILMAEDELVEDYLEGSLSESEKAKFLDQYAHGPRERRKLRIAQSIKEYGLAEARRQTGNSTIQKLRGLISWRWPKERRLFALMAVTVATLLVVTAVWLVQWNNQRTRNNNLKAAIERELTELNSPSNLSKNPSPMLSVVLPSVALRSHRPPDVTSRLAYRIVELQLLLTQQQEFQSYTAVLSRVGGIEELTIPNLHAEKNSAGRVVRLRLPSQALARSHYQISLSGVPNGSTEQYDLVVAD